MSRRSFSENELEILAAEATNFACSRGEMIDWGLVRVAGDGAVVRITFEVRIGAEEIEQILGGECDGDDQQE